MRLEMHGVEELCHYHCRCDVRGEERDDVIWFL